MVTREQADAEDRSKKLIATTPTLKAPKVGPTKATGAEAVATASAQAQKYAQELMEIPEMHEFGNVLKSSPLIELTEAETEYVVSLVKHIFKEHVVLQYEVKNTLPDTVLENVSVVATPADDEELEEVFIIQAEKLATDEPGKVYVAFKKIGGEASLPISTFTNVLKFTSKEIDPSTGEPEDTGYDDEYEVAEFDLSGSDYVIPTFAGNFSHIWEQVGASGEEVTETLQLSGMESIAGTSITENMQNSTLTNLQMLRSNLQRLCLCSRWRVPTCPSTRPLTHSSFWARQLAEAAWLPTSGWLSHQKQVSRQRSRCEARRRMWLP